MSTLAERWAAAVEAALEMSTPEQIVAQIRAADAPDDGLRAAGYEARIRSSLGDSHPERMALDPHPAPKISDWVKRDDEIRVAKAGLAFIDAISAINASRDHGTADTWDEAIKDAHLMAELHDGNFVSAIIDTSEDDSPFRSTIRAVDTLTRIARRWGCPHVATIQERLQHPDVCLSHARIGVERPVCGRLVLCKMCRDLLAEWCDPPLHHRDADHWPSNEMLAAHERGHTVEYRRFRAEYLAAHGMRSHAR